MKWRADLNDSGWLRLVTDCIVRVSAVVSDPHGRRVAMAKTGQPNLPTGGHAEMLGGGQHDNFV